MPRLFDTYCAEHGVEKKDRPILIIGNGGSASKIDWEWLRSADLDTFGMNSAYKRYEELSFYPTYYANLDDVVIVSHKERLQQLLDKKKIEKYFYLKWCSWKKYPDHCYEFTENERYIPVTKTGAMKLSVDCNDFHSWGNTGADCVQLALMMGYGEIYVIGIDGYVEKIPGAKEIIENGRTTLVMDQTPSENPNYWFSDYQEEGEEFNYPNSATAHVPGWLFSKNVCDALGVQYFNMSRPDYVPDIQHIDYDRFVAAIDSRASAGFQQRREPQAPPVLSPPDSARLDLAEGFTSIAWPELSKEEQEVRVQSAIEAGEAAFEAADFTTARLLFESVLLVDPENAQAHGNVGVVHFSLGEFEEALRHLELASQLSPNDATISENLVFVRQAMSLPPADPGLRDEA